MNVFLFRFFSASPWNGSEWNRLTSVKTLALSGKQMQREMSQIAAAISPTKMSVAPRREESLSTSLRDQPTLEYKKTVTRKRLSPTETESSRPLNVEKKKDGRNLNRVDEASHSISKKETAGKQKKKVGGSAHSRSVSRQQGISFKQPAVSETTAVVPLVDTDPIHV